MWIISLSASTSTCNVTLVRFWFWFWFWFWCDYDDDEWWWLPKLCTLNRGKTTAKWCLNNNKLRTPNNCHTNLVHRKRKPKFEMQMHQPKICRKVWKKEFRSTKESDSVSGKKLQQLGGVDKGEECVFHNKTRLKQTDHCQSHAYETMKSRYCHKRGKVATSQWFTFTPMTGIRQKQKLCYLFFCLCKCVMCV